jgi:hypothetical protein
VTDRDCLVLELALSDADLPIVNVPAAQVLVERGLVEYYGLSRRRLTEDGARVFGKLVQVMEEYT